MVCAKNLPANFKFCSYNRKDIAAGKRQLLIKTTHKGDLFVGDIGNKNSVRADGVVSGDYSLAVSMFTADCAPLVLIDTVTGTWGFMHVNWYGAASGQAGRAVRRMVKDFGTKPENIAGVIGPTICVDCYIQKGWSGLAKKIIYFLQGQFGLIKRVGKEAGLDLRQGIIENLFAAGVSKDKIEDLKICTCHDNWPSHVREGRDRRWSLLSILEIK